MTKESKELEKREQRGWVNPFDEMARTFERFLDGRWMRPFWREDVDMPEVIGGRVPRVDLMDRGETLCLRAELPGVKKDDIKITVTDNSITLRGETKSERKEEKEGAFYRRELSYGSFSRTLPLPAPVDPEHAKATFKDGILEVNLKKVNPAKHRAVAVE